MLTIKAEVLRKKVRNDGTYNVRIRFTKDRIVKRVSTSLFATDVDLTSDSKLREGSLIKQEADRLILHYRTMFSTFHLDSENYDVNEIVNRLLNKDEADKPIDFIAFCRKWIADSQTNSKETYTTSERYPARFRLIFIQPRFWQKVTKPHILTVKAQWC